MDASHIDNLRAAIEKAVSRVVGPAATDIHEKLQGAEQERRANHTTLHTDIRADISSTCHDTQALIRDASEDVEERSRRMQRNQNDIRGDISDTVALSSKETRDSIDNQATALTNTIMSGNDQTQELISAKIDALMGHITQQTQDLKQSFARNSDADATALSRERDKIRREKDEQKTKFENELHAMRVKLETSAAELTVVTDKLIVATDELAKVKTHHDPIVQDSRDYVTRIKRLHPELTVERVVRRRTENGRFPSPSQIEHRRSPSPTPDTIDYGELTEIFAWDGTRELTFSDLDPVVKNELLAWVKRNELGANIYASARNRIRSCAYNIRSDACMVPVGDGRIACHRCVGGSAFCLRRRDKNDTKLSIFALHPREREGAKIEEVAYWVKPKNRARVVPRTEWTQKLYED